MATQRKALTGEAEGLVLSPLGGPRQPLRQRWGAWGIVCWRLTCREREARGGLSLTPGPVLCSLGLPLGTAGCLHWAQGAGWPSPSCST